MNCGQVQTWLLEAADPRPESCVVGAIAAHLQTCSSCRLLARQLADLEQTWRSLPTSEEVEKGKLRFLDRLAVGTLPMTLGEPRISRRSMIGWFAASAASLLAVGTGTWLLFPAGQAQGSDDLLDHLVDWNLQLTEAGSEEERSRLYAEKAGPLQAQLKKANLPADQVELAEEFLENGTWLVSHQDPVIEADRFDNLADRLLHQAHTVGTRGNHRRMHRLLQQYNRVLESGTGLNLDRAEKLSVLDNEHQGKLERLVLGDPERMKLLESLKEKVPEASRKEIEKALGIYQKRKGRHHHRKSPGRKGESGRNGTAKK